MDLDLWVSRGVIPPGSAPLRNNPSPVQRAATNDRSCRMQDTRHTCCRGCAHQPGTAWFFAAPKACSRPQYALIITEEGGGELRTTGQGHQSSREQGVDDA
jgi:hypothetical protein